MESSTSMNTFMNSLNVDLKKFLYVVKLSYNLITKREIEDMILTLNLTVSTYSNLQEYCDPAIVQVLPILARNPKDKAVKKDCHKLYHIGDELFRQLKINKLIGTFAFGMYQNAYEVGTWAYSLGYGALCRKRDYSTEESRYSVH